MFDNKTEWRRYIWISQQKITDKISLTKAIILQTRPAIKLRFVFPWTGCRTLYLKQAVHHISVFCHPTTPYPTLNTVLLLQDHNSSTDAQHAKFECERSTPISRCRAAIRTLKYLGTRSVTHSLIFNSVAHNEVMLMGDNFEEYGQVKRRDVLVVLILYTHCSAHYNGRMAWNEHIHPDFWKPLLEQSNLYSPKLEPCPWKIFQR
jgi:hypothetical protein